MPTSVAQTRQFLFDLFQNMAIGLVEGYELAAKEAGVPVIPSAHLEISQWLNAQCAIATHGATNRKNARYLDEVFTEACVPPEMMHGLFARRVYYWEASAALRAEDANVMQYWISMSWRAAQQVLSQTEPGQYHLGLGPVAWRDQDFIAEAPPAVLAIGAVKALELDDQTFGRFFTAFLSHALATAPEFCAVAAALVEVSDLENADANELDDLVVRVFEAETERMSKAAQKLENSKSAQA